MFTGFSLMLQAFFRALTQLATGLEKFASAFDSVGGWTKATAEAFADQAEVEREQKLAVLKHNRDEQAKTLANTSGQVQPTADPVV